MTSARISNRQYASGAGPFDARLAPAALLELALLRTRAPLRTLVPKLALLPMLALGLLDSASAQDAAAGTEGSDLVNGTTFAGYESPDALPGYAPSTDPRDFRGVWTNRPQRGGLPFQIMGELPFTSRAAEQADYRSAMEAAGTTVATNHIMCRPTGARQIIGPIAPIYILQNEAELVFIVADEIRDVRHIYFDDAHPADLVPSYGGHSIARWDGDTLVVDTVGFNGTGELNKAVYSTALHITQRIRKSDDGTVLSFKTTLEDPATFTEPVVVEREWVWLPGRQPLEFDCEENPREDNFSGMVFESEYLRPVCIQHEGEGEQLSYVRCEAP
jgi:hypothetical protein